MAKRPLLALLIVALLGGCIDRVDRPRPRARPAVTPAGPMTGFRNPATLKQCVGMLDRVVPRYALLPDREFGGGCSALGAVQLRDIGTPVTNLGAMTCGLAEAFTQWVQDDLQGPARSIFGSRVVRVESMGTYACRNVNGAATGRLSEHARANAVDISAFILADGRRISIKNGWAGGDEGDFLRAVRASACRRFQTVLSPDYNTAHHDHLHFDMGGHAFCR